MIQEVHEAVLHSISEERRRQESLKDAGRFTFTTADVGMLEPQKAACIMEEVGEVCRNVLARLRLVEDGERSDEALYRELTQVAALSAGWMEALLVDMAEDFHP